jgi:hypothetical protein
MIKKFIFYFLNTKKIFIFISVGIQMWMSHMHSHTDLVKIEVVILQIIHVL